MTDLPADAITTATIALHERGTGRCACESAEQHEYWLAEDEAAAKTALEAAAPHITAAERQRIIRITSVDNPAPDHERLGLHRLAAADGALAERKRIQGLFNDWIEILMAEPNSHPPAAWKAAFDDLINAPQPAGPDSEPEAPGG